MTLRKRLRSASNSSSNFFSVVMSRDMPKLAMIEIDAVGQIVEQRVKEVPLVRESFFNPLTFDGITHGAGEQTTVHLALHQIILRALVDGRDGQRFVVASAQDNDGDLRRAS